MIINERHHKSNKRCIQVPKSLQRFSQEKETLIQQIESAEKPLESTRNIEPLHGCIPCDKKI
jgi:hypothetical protein